MIISHKYKFVFIHIPKTGGTFVTDLILKLDKDAINVIDRVLDNGHQPFSQIKNLDFYGEIKNYTFFTIIRNPIDQLLSWYNYAYHMCKYKCIFDVLDFPDYSMDIYAYCVEDHDSINDPEIIKIPLEKIKEKLTELFKKLNIDTSSIDIDYTFGIKINESQMLINKKMFEEDIEFRNSILKHKTIMNNLYYYNLFS